MENLKVLLLNRNRCYIMDKSSRETARVPFNPSNIISNVRCMLLGKTEKRNSELGEISILIHSIEMVTEITHIYTPGKAKQGKRIN